MTIWQPNLESRSGPRYLAIADAIAEDVVNGHLEPGSRLPPHRDLAWRLGVTVGTVTRAYGEARRRGLVQGEVGRGTFVSEPGRAGEVTAVAYPDDGLIDLAVNYQAVHDEVAVFAGALQTIAAQDNLEAFLRYQPPTGMAAHREAGAQWCARTGVTASPDQIVVCSGGQHAIHVALASVAHAGDLVLTEALTYPGAKGAAAVLGLRLQGVAMDEQGLRPDAFEAACRGGSAKALYCMSRLHNPAVVTMPLKRREEIVAIAERYNLLIVEDDVYGFLVDDPAPPLAAMAPWRSYYISSLSKCLGPGLRVGYLVTPPGQSTRAAAAVRASLYMATPLAAEVGAQLIHSGAADRVVGKRRREAAARQALVDRTFAGHSYRRSDTAFHTWIDLPPPWRANDFAGRARDRGVAITPAEAFVVGRAAAPHAIRICLCGVSTHAELNRGLAILRQILDADYATDGITV